MYGFYVHYVSCTLLQKERNIINKTKRWQDSDRDLIPIHGHSPFISFSETALRVNLSYFIVVQSRVF